MLFNKSSIKREEFESIFDKHIGTVKKHEDCIYIYVDDEELDKLVCYSSILDEKGSYRYYKEIIECYDE